MFLISLILFPIISWYIFNKYKDRIIELNWIVKLIWIIWLFIFSIFIFSNIFSRNEVYLTVIIIWYIVVFYFFYFKSISLEYANIDKLKYNNFSYWEWVLKVLFLIFIFILYWNMANNYKVNSNFWFFRNSDSLFSTSFIWTFLLLFILFWVIFQFLDMIKNGFFRRMINNLKFQEKLKEELKADILAELKK